MSAMVRRPGVTRRIFGMLLTVIDAVATSPWRPPITFDVTRGLPYGHGVVGLGRAQVGFEV